MRTSIRKGLRADKGSANRKHFKKRLFERYGLFANRFEIHQLVANLQAEGVYMGTLTRNRVWYRIPFKGRVIGVIYDRKNKNFVTALPKDSYPIGLGSDTMLPIDRPVARKR